MTAQFPGPSPDQWHQLYEALGAEPLPSAGRAWNRAPRQQKVRWLTAAAIPFDHALVAIASRRGWRDLRRADQDALAQVIEA